MTLIAEDVALLLLDEESGKKLESMHLDAALGGAVLLELSLAEAVDVGEKQRFWSKPKVELSSAGAVAADPILRRGLETVGEKPRSAEDLVRKLGKGLFDELAERLRSRGVVQEKEGHTLGIFPTRRWPTADHAYRRQLVDGLAEVITGSQEPAPRAAAVLSLLSAIDKAHKVVQVDGLSAREVKRRAKDVIDGAWASEAVRDAVRSANSAVAGAVAATAAAGAATSGG